MKLEDIKSLIDKINTSDLAYFELETEDGYVKMDKSLTRNLSEKAQTPVGNVISSVANENSTVVEANNIDKVEINNVDDVNTTTINAPMVGTFYGAAAPGKESFVSKGSKVSKGDVLCIVEAMKLMNEIESDFECEIIDVLVKEGQMVEYGEPLFKIRRA